MTLFIVDPYVKPYYEEDYHTPGYKFEILPLPFNVFSNTNFVCDLIKESIESKVVIHLTYTGFNSSHFLPFDNWYGVLRAAEQHKGRENVTLVLPITIPNCSGRQKKLISRLRLRLKQYCVRRGVRCLTVMECYDVFKLGLDTPVQDISQGFSQIETTNNWSPTTVRPLYSFK